MRAIAPQEPVRPGHPRVALPPRHLGLVARTADGSVRLGEVVRGTVSLRTASGSVEVGIRSGTAAWLDVKSSAGEVRTELESTGDPGGAGDTAEITARTWDGDITVFRAA